MKFLACDLDGTLVETKNCNIIDENIYAIKRLREEGHKFIISTGRDLKGVKSILKKYNDLKFDYLILCNGAIILDNNLNEVFRNTIPHNLVKSVYDNFYNNSLDTAMYVTYDECSSVFYKEAYHELDDFLGTFENRNNQDEIFSKERDFNLISVFSISRNYKNAEQIKETLLYKLHNKCEIFRNQAFVDIVAKNCSKGAGIKKILELENWNINKLYVIGDSFNDISMFDITKNSFTFNHVEDAIKSAANHKVDAVHECIDIILQHD